MRWALPATVGVTAAWAVGILSWTPGYQPWLTPLIVGSAAISIAGLVVGVMLRARSVVMAAAVLAAIAVLAGPTAYAVTTVDSPVAGSLVTAGPAGDDGGQRGGPGATAIVSSDLVSFLEANRGAAAYLAAGFGSQVAAPLIIATGEPVVTIGGFNGGDPAPTLAEFQQMVTDGEVRFLIADTGGPGGGPGGNSQIATWAARVGTLVDSSLTGGATVYDLSTAAD
jgi:4-amino-4-deoxy-L-arabinose transferase-like glycosyltransferase